MDRFFGNKKYVFRKRLLEKDLGHRGSTWTNKVDGREVIVISKTSALCKDDEGESYGVAPEWCEEIFYDEKEDSDN